MSIYPYLCEKRNRSHTQTHNTISVSSYLQLSMRYKIPFTHILRTCEKKILSIVSATEDTAHEFSPLGFSQSCLSMA